MDNLYFYEQFIRNAFNVGRSEDPAGLADTSYFYQENLSLIKVAVTYAMATYQHKQSIMEDSNYRVLVDSVLSAEKIEEISYLIEKFKIFLKDV